MLKRILAGLRSVFGKKAEDMPTPERGTGEDRGDMQNSPKPEGNAGEEWTPPVPSWRPEFSSELSLQLDRMRYYTEEGKDLLQFQNGTIVILDDGLDDQQAEESAKAVLSEIFHYHPDMNPLPMDDGNILVQYNHPAYNVVLSSDADERLDEIRKRHLSALAQDEVLITPLGPNTFDEFGMKALYGRCFMFMDAQEPVVHVIHRATGNMQ